MRSDYNVSKSAYKALAIGVLGQAIKDVTGRSEFDKESAIRFARTRRCVEMCDLAGINYKQYRSLIMSNT